MAKGKHKGFVVKGAHTEKRSAKKRSRKHRGKKHNKK
jgi:hypothetical protein